MKAKPKVIKRIVIEIRDDGLSKVQTKGINPSFEDVYGLVSSIMIRHAIHQQLTHLKNSEEKINEANKNKNR